MQSKLLISACFAFAATTAPGALVITEVMSNSSHAGGAGNGDWFEIHNTGSSPVDLSGYSWDDDSATAGSHTFGSISIAAGGFVLVVDENATLITNWINDVWNVTAPNVVVIGNAVGGFSGFGANGDQIYIYNNLNVVLASVTFGSSTSGKTFEWDADGNSLGLSTNGENGANFALLDGNDNAADNNPSLYGVGTDIGSPGFAVPEPSVALLGGMGLLGLLRCRRD
jgi:hypothetical protein